MMKLAFIGAMGKMGRSMMEGVLNEKDMEIVGAVDISDVGKEAIPCSGVFV